MSAFLEGITTPLKDGENVTLIGFGRFGIKKRAGRKIKNPRTGMEMQVDEKFVPFFKASKEVKQAIDSYTKQAKFKQGGCFFGYCVVKRHFCRFVKLRRDS